MNSVKSYGSGMSMAFLMMRVILCVSSFQPVQGQDVELKWLRIGELQNFFTEYGAEYEGSNFVGNNCQLFWPAAYGFKHYSSYSKGLWMGSKNYYDQAVGQTLACKVVGIGTRQDNGIEDKIFPSEFKLIGRFNHPMVIVDDGYGSAIEDYDVLDEVDDNLSCDRLMVTKFHTSLGVTVTRKIMAWGHPNHDNYFVYDYVFKNTGIINADGGVYQQTLDDFYACMINRYTLAGEAMPGYNQGWGPFNAMWGSNTVNQVIGADPSSPDFKFRAMLSWYGPHSAQPVTDDWGCPDYLNDGHMSAARYAGAVVLHADKSARDYSDNPYQPMTTHYLGSDHMTAQPPYNQYDETFMQARYEVMTAGHAAKTHAEEVGNGYADLWGDDQGGYSQTQGFGPYTLEPGDSIHIVLAEGVAGLSREKNREVGENWFSWFKSTGNPVLVGPDGSTTTDYDAYKRQWVWTCEDSLMQTFENATQNYNCNYNISLPPPPPEIFYVTTGADRIRLSWSDNADSFPNFNGYVIYRSKGNVLQPETVYEKIFECDASTVIHTYDDTSAAPGVDCYYYIISRDDGSMNDIRPGVPLTSSMFWTLTRTPARKISTVHVNPGDADIAGKLPVDFSLEQNTPNPFNPVTEIKFALPVGQDVNLMLYNMLGQEVRTVIRAGYYEAGVHTVRLDSEDLESGLYIYRIEAGTWSEFRKMMVVK